MNIILLIGLLVPFLGTTLGAACVYLIKDEIPALIQKILLGFAAGVMVAASVWSLLIPAMEQCEDMGKLSFVPATVGFALGILFLLAVDKMLPHLHMHEDKPEGLPSKLQKSTMMVFAVTLHNIPEGMAVGITFAGVLSGETGMTLAGAIALAVGIAIQNFPEGAVVSLPLKNETKSSHKAFLYGMFSGIVEPLGAGITILLTGFIAPALPYMLAFAAGAMIYVVVEELIPEASAGNHSNIGTIGFAAGFLLMMILDVAMG
ncbi:MAG: ZIP family metal transporter [Lachnospiraceae bacterium]|nr:ZIP family metal transporter [Lachnospiraceae bacterium]